MEDIGHRFMRKLIYFIFPTILLFVTTVTAQESSRNDISNWLKMEGTVNEITLKDVGSIVEVEINLNLTIKNIGQKPVFIYEKDLPINSHYLSISIANAKNNDYAYSESFGLANSYGSDESLKKINLLNKEIIPKELFLTLLPTEIKTYQITTTLELEKKPYIYGRKKWSEISKKCENWLKVGSQLWPASILEADSSKLEFGKALQKRWQNEGYLALGNLKSEPIQVIFPNSTNCN